MWNVIGKTNYADSEDQPKFHGWLVKIVNSNFSRGPNKDSAYWEGNSRLDRNVWTSIAIRVFHIFILKNSIWWDYNVAKIYIFQSDSNLCQKMTSSGFLKYFFFALFKINNHNFKKNKIIFIWIIFRPKINPNPKIVMINSVNMKLFWPHTIGLTGSEILVRIFINTRAYNNFYIGRNFFLSTFYTECPFLIWQECLSSNDDIIKRTNLKCSEHQNWSKFANM